jgi:hypothetical protein
MDSYAIRCPEQAEWSIRAEIRGLQEWPVGIPLPHIPIEDSMS